MKFQQVSRIMQFSLTESGSMDSRRTEYRLKAWKTFAKLYCFHMVKLHKKSMGYKKGKYVIFENCFAIKTINRFTKKENQEFFLISGS